MASSPSLYDVLNVSPDAEGVVIEAAYRALMKKYHPDQAAAPAGVNGSSSAAEINQAFAVLRDPQRRADYDHREWTRHQAFHLAESQILPQPRRRSAFGWSGWFLALLLGAILFTIVNGRGGFVTPPAEGNGAAAAEPDHRTQPEKIEPAFTAGVAPTELDREIVLREAETEARRKAAPPDEAADAAPQPILVEEPRAALPPRFRSAPYRAHARPARRPGRAGAMKKEDEDFLKREGYIY